jgi:hypothetical protein
MTREKEKALALFSFRSFQSFCTSTPRLCCQRTQEKKSFASRPIT